MITMVATVPIAPVLLSTPFWEFLTLSTKRMVHLIEYFLSTPFWEFQSPTLHQCEAAGSNNLLSTPFWEFHVEYVDIVCNEETVTILSTPFWEFLCGTTRQGLS